MPGGFTPWGAASAGTAGGCGAALGMSPGPLWGWRTTPWVGPLGDGEVGDRGGSQPHAAGPAERSWLSAGCWLRSPLAAADRRREVLKIPSAPPGAAFPGTTLQNAPGGCRRGPTCRGVILGAGGGTASKGDAGAAGFGLSRPLQVLFQQGFGAGERAEASQPLQGSVLPSWPSSSCLSPPGDLSEALEVLQAAGTPGELPGTDPPSSAPAGDSGPCSERGPSSAPGLWMEKSPRPRGRQPLAMAWRQGLGLSFPGGHPPSPCRCRWLRSGLPHGSPAARLHGSELTREDGLK